MSAPAICPKCNVVVESHRCRLCGSTKTINSVSGNQIWMLNGRVVKAFKDSRIAWIKMARRNHIPHEEWPEEFLPPQIREQLAAKKLEASKAAEAVEPPKSTRLSAKPKTSVES